MISSRRLDWLFESSLALLVFLPFLMIALGGGVGPVMGVLFPVAAVASLVFHGRGMARKEYEKFWNAIVVAWVVFSGIDMFVSETSILDASISVVLVLTLVKLFSRLSERDELQIYALSFLMLAAATAVNEDLTFGVLFGVYVLVGTFSLALFHLRSELAKHARLDMYRRVPLNAQYMSVLAGISAVILAASVAIFFVFPRVGLGFFQQKSRDGQSMAGFSDKVELGGHGTIRDNPEVVMRVEFPNGRWPDEASIHWRAVTFDTYDGRAWSQKLGREPLWARRTDRSTYDLAEFYPPSEPRDTIQIYLEPLGTNVLPIVPPVSTLRLGTEKYSIPWGPKSGQLGVTPNGDVMHTIQSELGIGYRLELLEPPPPADADYETPDEVYLQTPDLSARTRELARQVAGDGGNDARAAAVKRHLQANYDYTLEQTNVGNDPIDSFLFETKAGHCEYFASTMVMMLREVGVHARLVNGFLGGRWNDAGGYLAVRQGDAHSWVEYWSPRRGWVQIDPTPADGLTPSATESILETAREYWDAMRLNWMKWIIEYDLVAQIEFFRRAGEVLKPRGLMGPSGGEADDGTDFDPNADGNVALRHGFVFGGLVFLALLANRHVRRRLRPGKWTVVTVVFSLAWIAAGASWLGFFQGFEPSVMFGGGGAVGAAILLAAFRAVDRTTSATALFQRIERRATAAGVPRAEDEPPGRYLERLEERFPAANKDLGHFRRRYLRARFGGVEDVEEAADLRALAARVERNLTPKNRRHNDDKVV